MEPPQSKYMLLNAPHRFQLKHLTPLPHRLIAEDYLSVCIPDMLSLFRHPDPNVAALAQEVVANNLKSRATDAVSAMQVLKMVRRMFPDELRDLPDLASFKTKPFDSGSAPSGGERETPAGEGESGQPEGPKFGRPAALPISLAHAYEDSAPACRQPADSRRVHGKHLPLADRRSRAAQQDRGSGAGLRRRQLRGLGRGARQSDLSARRQGSPRSRVPRSRPQRPPGDAARTGRIGAYLGDDDGACAGLAENVRRRRGRRRPNSPVARVRRRRPGSRARRLLRPGRRARRRSRCAGQRSCSLAQSLLDGFLGAAPSSTTPAAGGTWPIHGAAGPRSTIARWRRSRRAPRG